MYIFLWSAAEDGKKRRNEMKEQIESDAQNCTFLYARRTAVFAFIRFYCIATATTHDGSNNNNGKAFTVPLKLGNRSQGCYVRRCVANNAYLFHCFKSSPSLCFIFLLLFFGFVFQMCFFFSHHIYIGMPRSFQASYCRCDFVIAYFLFLHFVHKNVAWRIIYIWNEEKNVEVKRTGAMYGNAKDGQLQRAKERERERSSENTIPTKRTVRHATHIHTETSKESHLIWDTRIITAKKHSRRVQNVEKCKSKTENEICCHRIQSGGSWC